MKLVRLPANETILDSVVDISKAVSISISGNKSTTTKWVHINFGTDNDIAVHFTEAVKLYHFHKRLLEVWSKSLDFVQGYSEMDRPGGIIDLAAELENLVQPANPAE